MPSIQIYPLDIQISKGCLNNEAIGQINGLMTPHLRAPSRE